MAAPPVMVEPLPDVVAELPPGPVTVRTNWSALLKRFCPLSDFVKEIFGAATTCTDALELSLVSPVRASVTLAVLAIVEPTVAPAVTACVNVKTCC